ncbi:MAG TPA: DUF1592 domain-containing protein [Polyangia bacterium]
MESSRSGWRCLIAKTALVGQLLGAACTGEVGEQSPGGGMTAPNGGATSGGGNNPSGNNPSGNNTGAPPPVSSACLAASARPSVGVSPLRRLTRTQYNHTVRDLLGLQGDHAASLGLDEKVGHFYSNVNNPVSELAVEQYMTAADALATRAVSTNLATLVPCDAAADPAGCGAKFVDSFGQRAFRRPLLNEEKTAMLALFEAGRKDENFEGGVRRVVAAMLQSPQFLYHIELGAPTGGAEVVGLDSFKVGARLSYFLWDSMPDAELLRAAGANELTAPVAIRKQAERMLNDARAAETIANFHKQWLGTDMLPILEKDAKIYPAFTPALRDSMINEGGRFADHVLRAGDGQLETLFTAPLAFVDEPLAKLYGVSLPAGHDPSKPVKLDPSKRAGILTQAGLLAAHAHADQSSPIRRGKLVRENLFCQTLAPPPPDADITPPEPDPKASTRSRFEMHRADPQCKSCHALIDPLGFGFENYDGIGAYRDQEAGAAVDARGEIVGTDVDGPFNGVGELSRKLASSPTVRACVASHWFNYALGRVAGDADKCAMEAVTAAFAKTNNLRDLILALVTSDAFRYGRFDTRTGAP